MVTGANILWFYHRWYFNIFRSKLKRHVRKKQNKKIRLTQKSSVTWRQRKEAIVQLHFCATLSLNVKSKNFFHLYILIKLMVRNCMWKMQFQEAISSRKWKPLLVTNTVPSTLISQLVCRKCIYGNGNPLRPSVWITVIEHNDPKSSSHGKDSHAVKRQTSVF